MTTEQAMKRLENIREEVEKKISGLPPLIQDRSSLHSVAQALKMAIDALEDQDNNRWIPVTERLPKCFGTFIVAVTEPDKTAYTDSADYDPFQKTWKTSNYFAKGYEVTHWMPLPKPPKEG